MSKKYQVIEETLAYATAEDVTNTDPRYLVAGSRNVLIDRQKKARSRNGFSRLGASSAAQTPPRNAVTWNTSTGTELLLRGPDTKLQLYLATVDGVAVDTWYDLASGFGAAPIPRFTTWYDSTEGIDELLFVWGDDNIYEWSGAVAVVDSVTATTLTKEGTDTFAQNRFYTAANKVLVNLRTGTEYTYTGGESTTTLTGIADTTGIIAGDVLAQKVVTSANQPASGRNNHNIFTFENQVCVGSNDDEEVYVSANDDYTDYTFSAPRVPGEGALFTLDDTAKGYGILAEKLVIFAGRSSIYEASPLEITVGSTLTETFQVKKYQAGDNQSAQSQEVIVQVGQSIIYLSHEPAVRELVSLEQISGGAEPRTLSNPIKPDFDAEDWTNACAAWYKNGYYLTAPANGRLYILEYVEDADGKLRRFWQTPQTIFVRALTPYDGKLYGHSSAVIETYYLFDPDMFSDINSDDEKMAIHCVWKYAYRNYGDRVNMKTFDEYFVEGEISPSTDTLLTLNYDFGGFTQQIEKTIEGSDGDILLETLVNTSLGQQPLGQSPLGGSIIAPDNTAKFRVIFEIAKEDFTEMQDVYETNSVDKYFAVIARGANAQISRRQNNVIKK